MCRTGSLIALSVLAAVPQIFAQTPASPMQAWTGWAQCQITIQAPGYSHSETHLWTVAGAGTKNANMEISPMTWTVTGSGSLQRTNGPTAVTAQWTVNGTLGNLTMGATLHRDRITIQRWTNHGPARGALTGTEISTTNGVPRSRLVVLDVQQWAFPGVETGTTSTRATGSNSLPFAGLRGPMNPPNGAMGTAACTWDFARGASSPSAAPSMPVVTTPTSPTSGGAASGGVPNSGGSGAAGAVAGGAAGGPVISTPVGGNTGGEGGSAASGGSTGAPSSNAALLSISPNAVEQGVSAGNALVMTLTGQGTNWQQGTTTANFGPGITLTGAQVQSPTRLTTVIQLVDYSAVPGPRAVTVTTGSQVVTLPSALTVISRTRPTVQISPNSALAGQQGVTVTFTGNGTRWEQGTTAVIPTRQGVTVSEKTVNSPTSMTVKLDISSSTAPGPVDITVLNSGSFIGTDIISMPGAFTIAGVSSPGDRTPRGSTAELAITSLGPAPPDGGFAGPPAFWAANGTARYGMAINNFGPGTGDGATLTIPASPGLTKTSVSCTGYEGAQPVNPPVAQIETGFVIPTLPSSGYLFCTLWANVTGTAGTNVTVTVTLTPPAGFSDPNPRNNTATNTLPIR